MPKLPVISGAEAVKAFEQAGWHVDRQRGSHVILLKSGMNVSLSVPQHRELAPGTLRSLIRAAGMTVEDFIAHTSYLTRVVTHSPDDDPPHMIPQTCQKTATAVTT